MKNEKCPHGNDKVPTRNNTWGVSYYPGCYCIEGHCYYSDHRKHTSFLDHYTPPIASNQLELFNQQKT